MWEPLASPCRPSASYRPPKPSRQAGIERRAGLRRGERNARRRRRRRTRGAAEIDVSGADASIVQAREAGDATHCRRRRSRGRRSCGTPFARPNKPWATRTRPKLSRIETAFKRRAGLRRGEREARRVADVVPEGPPRSRCPAPTHRSVQAREAGIASTLPAASIARTSKLWEPLARPGVPSASYRPPRPSRLAGTRRTSRTQTRRTRRSPRSKTSRPTGPPRSTCPGRTHRSSRPARRGSGRRCRRRRSPARQSCGSHWQARCRPSASCKPPKASRRDAVERRAGLRRGERKARRSRPVVVPEGPAEIEVSGGGRIDRPGPRGGGRVDIAGGSSPHVKAVGATGKPEVGLRELQAPQAEPSSRHSTSSRTQKKRTKGSPSRRRLPEGPPKSTCPAPTHPHSRAAKPETRRHCPRRRSPARQSCGSHRPARVGLRRAASPPGRTVQTALERRAGLRRSERKARRSRRRTNRQPRRAIGRVRSAGCHYLENTRRVTRRSRRRYLLRLWRARRNVCEPTARPAQAFGELHDP